MQEVCMQVVIKNITAVMARRPKIQVEASCRIINLSNVHRIHVLRPEERVHDRELHHTVRSLRIGNNNNTIPVKHGNIITQCLYHFCRIHHGPIHSVLNFIACRYLFYDAVLPGAIGIVYLHIKTKAGGMAVCLGNIKDFSVFKSFDYTLRLNDICESKAKTQKGKPFFIHNIFFNILPRLRGLRPFRKGQRIFPFTIHHSH